MLNRNTKLYLKKIACCPETIKESDYRLCSLELTDSEKCHLALLAMEAKRQSSILYALHNLMRYMME